MYPKKRGDLMEDFKIVDLYWERSERAISETRTKYEKMLSGISYSLLKSREDAEECVNDTYLSAWNQMPSDRPTYLGAYLSKIIRALSIDKFRSRHSKRRGGFDELCAELDECISSGVSIEEQYDNEQLVRIINRFLESLSEERRVIFVRRYFHSDTVEQIAERMRISRSKVKTSLFRMREELKQILEKEGMPV